VKSKDGQNGTHHGGPNMNAEVYDLLMAYRSFCEAEARFLAGEIGAREFAEYWRF
jgi:hypothetical protein